MRIELDLNSIQKYMTKEEFLEQHDTKVKGWLIRAPYILEYLPIAWWEQNIF
jgi:hypothetical protein